MNNKSMNRFATNPVNIDISRSTFNLDQNIKTTFNSGKLVPFYCSEVLPGDTFNVSTSIVMRMLTPVVPTMDNAFLDVYYFFVPNRLSCEAFTGDSKRWQKVCGENASGFWAPSQETLVPEVHINKTDKNSLATYFGFPICSAEKNIDDYFNAMPFTSYYLIFNEWFRDENLQAPYNLLSNGDWAIQTIDINNGGNLVNVNKFHDYFTSCLPAPQKGPSVLSPLSGTAPVLPTTPHANKAYFNESGNVLNGYSTLERSLNPQIDEFTTNSWIPFESSNSLLRNVAYRSNNTTISNGSATNTSLMRDAVITPITANNMSALVFDNLVADLTHATGANVNQIRQSFAIQRMLEKDARGGSRYKEILKAHFDINFPDSTLQRPEYLGGKRLPLNLTQTIQSVPTADSPLGFTGAYSQTNDNDKSFIKSFGEHGFVIGVCCVRTQQCYFQGIPKVFTKKRRFDYYWPSFANLGEQAILNKEIYGFDGGLPTDEVFGYQEAWADYRYMPNRLTGEMNPDSGNLSFVPWTYATGFSTTPTLSDSFIKQDSSNIGQTLAQTDTTCQFFADILISNKATRALPLYSIPGLIDHH